MKFRVIRAKSFDPYLNLALEEYLFRFAGNDFYILYLWQNEDTVVIGRNQDAAAECKVDEFISTGGRIARRRSGGGAVYHDKGNLNFSIIGRKEELKEGAYREFIIKLLKYLKLETYFSGRNDILCNGKKISGNAVYDDGMIICQHGTLLVNCNINRMVSVLTPNAEKMNRHCIKSVRSRVVNLIDFIPDITVEGIIDKIYEIYDTEPLELCIDGKLEMIKERYESDDWIYGGAS